MLNRSHIVGCGSYLPGTVIRNDDLAAVLDTSDEWIRSRSGIVERRFAAENEFTSDLAIAAGQAALVDADIDPKQVDAIIVGTTTSDNIFPSVATIVQRVLGADNAFAFDVQAVCSGFIYALSVADAMIRSGQARTVIVIGADVMSRITSPEDRATRVLFGDGAGAVVLQAGDPDSQCGILSTHLYSDGRYKDYLFVDGGPGQPKSTGYMSMNGREIFKLAVEKLSAAINQALLANNLTIGDIDWFVPHQANVRIIKSLAEHLHLPEDKVIVTIDRHGNTSAASIPLALCEAVKDGRITRGDLVVFEAMGGGLTWGSALVRW